MLTLAWMQLLLSLVLAGSFAVLWRNRRSHNGDLAGRIGAYFLMGVFTVYALFAAFIIYRETL